MPYGYFGRKEFVHRSTALRTGCAQFCRFKLLHRLLAAMEEKDYDQFEEALQSYDRIVKLNSFQVDILLIVKKKMLEEEAQDFT